MTDTGKPAVFLFICFEGVLNFVPCFQLAQLQITCDTLQMLQKLLLRPLYIFFFDRHQDGSVVGDAVFNVAFDLKGIFPELLERLYDLLVDTDQQLVVTAFDDRGVKALIEASTALRWMSLSCSSSFGV